MAVDSVSGAGRHRRRMEVDRAMVEKKGMKWSEFVSGLILGIIFLVAFSYVAASVVRSKDNVARIESLEATVTALTDDNTDDN